MTKPEWGEKQTCPKCGTRFYDLGNSDPAACIECGVEWVPEPILKTKQPIVREEEAPAAKKSEDDEDDEELEGVDDLEVDVEDDDEDDSDSIVDISLDDEESDVNDIVDVTLVEDES